MCGYKERNSQIHRALWSPVEIDAALIDSRLLCSVGEPAVRLRLSGPSANIRLDP